MRRRWFTTLRAQFVAVVAAAVILSSLAVVVILEYGRASDLRGARLDAAIDRIAGQFDYLSELPDGQVDTAVHALSGNIFRYAFSETAPFNNPVFSAEEREIGSNLVSDEMTKELGAPRVRLTETPNLGPDFDTEGPLVEIAQPLRKGGWLSVRWVRRPVPSPAPDLLIAAALGTILTGAAAAWLAGRVSRPLSALAYAAGEVARGRAAPRLRVQGPEDIRTAAEAFNEMSGRVTRTLESQRQLLSAVGHDLRTPLAAMRITAEFVEDRDTRERLMRNLDELQAMTEAVLSAARSGPGEEARRVDLAALIESVCDDLIEMEMPVQVDIDGSAPCLCRPNEIRRAVRNLVENAVRYGGSARVSLKKDPDFYIASVEDDGPGIPDDKLEEVFEPFVRLETSRNSATGGSGLGLTLARSIAREHGGDLVVENRRGANRVFGLKALLRLPREKSGAKEAAPAQPVEVAQEAMAK
jgi:signal transduction histidine kinase